MNISVVLNHFGITEHYYNRIKFFRLQAINLKKGLM